MLATLGDRMLDMRSPGLIWYGNSYHPKRYVGHIYITERLLQLAIDYFVMLSMAR